MFMLFIIPTISMAELQVGLPLESEGRGVDFMPREEEEPLPPAVEERGVPDPSPDTERGGLVQCGRKTITKTEPIVDKDGKPIPGKTREFTILDPADACNFDDLMHLVNNIINWILIGLAIPVAGIMFAYAGFTLITAGGDNSGARTKAKEIFLNAAIGLTLAFVAYLIVKFVLKTLGYNGTWIGF